MKYSKISSNFGAKFQMMSKSKVLSKINFRQTFGLLEQCVRVVEVSFQMLNVTKRDVFVRDNWAYNPAFLLKMTPIPIPNAVQYTLFASQNQHYFLIE